MINLGNLAGEDLVYTIRLTRPSYHNLLTKIHNTWATGNHDAYLRVGSEFQRAWQDVGDVFFVGAGR